MRQVLVLCENEAVEILHRALSQNRIVPDSYLKNAPEVRVPNNLSKVSISVPYMICFLYIFSANSVKMNRIFIGGRKFDHGGHKYYQSQYFGFVPYFYFKYNL